MWRPTKKSFQFLISTSINQSMALHQLKIIKEDEVLAASIMSLLKP
jgi:hypothetical protein